MLMDLPVERWGPTSGSSIKSLPSLLPKTRAIVLATELTLATAFSLVAISRAKKRSSRETSVDRKEETSYRGGRGFGVCRVRQSQSLEEGDE